MKPELILMDTFYVVGFPAIIKDNYAQIRELWDLLREAKAAVKNETGACIGLEFYPFDFTSTKQFYYMPCYVVTDLSDIPATMCGKVVEGGKYAVWKHKGTVATLHETFHKIYHEYLPASGFRFRQPYDFEWYDEKFLGPDNPESELQIRIPVM